MIRVLVVDDHPADPHGVLGEARRRHPDVALVDYHLREGDGLVLCRDLKSLPAPPRALDLLGVRRRKPRPTGRHRGRGRAGRQGHPTYDLFERVRTVARGGTALRVTAEVITAGPASLETRDLPILGMLLERTPRAEIAKVLRLDEHELDSRVEAMLRRLGIRTGHDPQRA